MARIQWTVGDVPTLRVVFKNPLDDTPINPTNVRLVLKRPGTAAVVYTFGNGTEIQNPSTGTFTFPLTLTTKGTYRWRWEGANGPDEGAAEEGSLDALSNI